MTTFTSGDDVTTSVETIQWPPWTNIGDLVSYGTSGMVLGLDVVLKVPHRSSERRFIDVEKQVYERLANGHDGILRYYGPLHDGLLLQHAAHLQIRSILAQEDIKAPFSSLSLRVRWIRQIVEAVVFVHSKGILHCDISCNNVFVDNDFDAKLGDFAGSSIDGSEPLVCYETRYSHPRDESVSIRSEIFALGSTMYEILTGSRPYNDLEDADIEKAYQLEQYPDLERLKAFKTVIANCWTARYQTVDELLRDVNAQGDSILHSVFVCQLTISSCGDCGHIATNIDSHVA
ncbi:MAG: hypothetical protein M1837_000344 [Sclerophora amabilis]|nr:MAG: hypothetical protein M1837_000344 [Sclerophora amabilis]